jgi:hypothetical protein
MNELETPRELAASIGLIILEEAKLDPTLRDPVGDIAAVLADYTERVRTDEWGREESDWYEAIYIGMEEQRKIDEEELATAHDMRMALEKLARLGNEPHFGNSDGNIIAQEALAKAEGKDQA